MTTSRRTFLAAGLAGSAALALGIGPEATAAAPALRRDPFTLGLASGDPWPRSVVLWTRLALEPLAADGRGGMPNRNYPLRWQIARDARFSRIAASGTAVARPEFGHAVHVTARGLQPGREYFYRFRSGSYVSAVGRTRTAPAANSLPQSLAMSFVSCSQYEHGWFTAYRRLAEDQPELVLHLGDYQYEYKRDTYVAPSGNVRDHEGPETVDLASYRQRHAQYKTDPDLQRAHAVAPWLVVWDDHEVDNNWAGYIPESPEQGFAVRRAAAFRAYYENMPLRPTSAPTGTQMQLYRKLDWGRLASFHMLDTRQFRDDQACGDGYDADCAAAVDPARSITGGEQERWLRNNFNASRARWDLLGQQVFFAQRDATSGPLKTVSMDAWDGYAASRDRITRAWRRAGVRNPVVLTGDVHAHWASDIKADFDNPDSATIGSELVCSSITSGGDGSDTASAWLGWNPHLKFHTTLRGYVNTTITPTQLDADFRCVAKVSVPDAPAFTRASFTLLDRERGLYQTADNPLTSALARRGDNSSDVIEWETRRPR